MPICLLVRHGHSTANGEGVLAGRLPGIHLDGRGRAQVSALAARLASLPIVRLATSPLERCAQTAKAIGDSVSPAVSAEDEPGLLECGYGAWTGRPLKELAEEPLWRTVQDQPSAARFPEGDGYAGESLAGMAHRAVATVRRIDAEVLGSHGPHALWAAVTHGDIIKAVLADAAGSHVDHFQRFQADPASVSVVRYTARRPFLVATNDVGGDLARLQPPPPQEAPEGDAAPGGGSAHE